MAAGIEFERVTRAYGDNTILRDFSLAVPENVTTALVGESGSGKSTLLMLSNGLLSPDTGSVHVMGKRVADTELDVLRRNIGYAVQGAGLFPHLTAAENVSLVAALNGWSNERVNERLTALFTLVELDLSHQHRYPHEMSGGEQQRVSLCRALMLDPPLLLLDEPFSALDPLTREAIHEEFVRVQALGERTIVLVTHDMSEAVKLAQHLVILKDGSIVQQGSVADVTAHPGDDYVRQLLGVA